MDASGSTQNRRHSRSNVMLKATLELPGSSVPVVLRNLSQEGALVEGEALPDEGTRVLFHRQGLSVPGRVAWTHCDQAGLQFDFPLYPRELLRHVPECDRKLPQLDIKKRPGFRAKPLTMGERLIIERWATESPTKLGE
jgi:hypothetical protein